MSKKILLGLVLAGLLTVPVGMALADDLPEGVTQTEVDEPDRDQVRDQDRLRDPSICESCPRLSDDTAAIDDLVVPGDMTRDQERSRDQMQDGDCEEGLQLHERVQEQEQLRSQYGSGGQQHGTVLRQGGTGYGNGPNS